MTELTPIPAEHRRVYYDALRAGRAEAARLGYGLLDDRIFAAFHRALYRPMIELVAGQVQQATANTGSVQWGVRVDLVHPVRQEKVGDVIKFGGSAAEEMARNAPTIWPGWTTVRRTVPRPSPWTPVPPVAIARGAGDGDGTATT